MLFSYSLTPNQERGVYGGLQLAFATLAALVLLELTSLDTVRRLRRDPRSGGDGLYRTACFLNVRNHLLFGVLTLSMLPP